MVELTHIDCKMCKKYRPTIREGNIRRHTTNETPVDRDDYYK